MPGRLGGHLKQPTQETRPPTEWGESHSSTPCAWGDLEGPCFPGSCQKSWPPIAGAPWLRCPAQRSSFLRYSRICMGAGRHGCYAPQGLWVLVRCTQAMGALDGHIMLSLLEESPGVNSLCQAFSTPGPVQVLPGSKTTLGPASPSADPSLSQKHSTCS